MTDGGLTPRVSAPCAMLIVLLLAFGLCETDACGLVGLSGWSAEDADMVLGVSVSVGGGESSSRSSTAGASELQHTHTGRQVSNRQDTPDFTVY